MTFAENLKNARKNAELTQTAMAQITKIPFRTIQQWESGDRIPPEYLQIYVLNHLQEIARRDEE
jgi:transcriptional regulator with XRE-family HTH domain